MKKILLWIIAGLPFIPISTQETKAGEKEKSFFVFNAGISVPIICYASSDINKKTAGFAKVGFTVDISYAYRVSTNAGVTGSVFYCANRAGSKTVTAPLSPGSYRFFGCMAGPFVTKNFATRWDADFKMLAGVARVLTPKLQQQDEIVLDENRTTCFAWGGGLALRYNLAGNSFLHLKTDHLNMKPQFTLKPDELGKGEQHIVVMNVDAGIGWRF